MEFQGYGAEKALGCIEAHFSGWRKEGEKDESFTKAIDS